MRKHGPFAFWTTHSRFFRPQSSVEFWLFDRLSGGEPWLLHLATFLFFIGSAILVRKIVLQLLAASGPGPGAEAAKLAIDGAAATTAGLIFAFYSSHCEPVNWLCCICDTAGTLEALLGLSLFLACIPATGWRRFALFAGATLCMALAMTSKEVFLVFPFFVSPLGFLMPGWRISKAKAISAFLGMSFILVIAYVLAHNALHNTWGYAGQFKTGRLTVENTLGLDIPNVFLPFAKWVGPLNEALVLWPVAILAVLVAWGVLHRVGPGRLRAGGARGTANWAAIYGWIAAHKSAIFLGWACVNFYFGQFWEGDPLWALSYVCLAGFFLLAAWRFRLYRYPLLVGILFVASCASLVSRENLLLYEFAHLGGVYGIMKGKIAAAFVLFYAYATRPAKVGIGEQDRRLLCIACGATLAALLLLVPAMDVSLVSIRGEGERLSYEATPFGAIAAAAFLAFFFRSKPKLFTSISAAYIALLGGALFLGNQQWAYAGKLSRIVLPQLSLLAGNSPHRIYLLSVPGFVGGAELFHNANDLLIRIARPGSRTEIASGDIESNHLPGDRVILRTADLKRLHFGLGLSGAAHPFGQEPNELAALGTGYFKGWFTSPSQGDLYLEGYRSGDRIVYIDGETVRIVR